MNREAAEAEVGRLLAEREELKRFGLRLGPKAEQRLKSLLLSLGWTTELMKLQRREQVIRRLARAAGVKRYARPASDLDNMFKTVGYAMDNPGHEAIFDEAADTIGENHPDDPAVHAFRKWVNGEGWKESGLLVALNPRTSGSLYSMVGPAQNYEALSAEPDLAHEIRPIGGGGLTESARHFDMKIPVPMFGRNRTGNLWHPRKWAGQRYPLHTRPDLRAKKRSYTSEEVARAVYAKDGPKGLIHMIVGAHHWAPSKNFAENGDVIPREGVPHIKNSRRGETVKRYKLIVPEEQNLFPEERDIVIGGTPGKQKTYLGLVGQGTKNRPGDMPGLDEIKSLAEVGEPVRGSYEEMHKFVSHLMKSPGDANRWVMANAVLSPQTPWEQHTAGAVEALGVWHAAGRPTDAKSLEQLFGKTQRNPRGTLQLDQSTPRVYKGPDLYSGYKAEQLKRIFGADRGESDHVGFGDFGGGEGLKVPNFGMAFVDPRGVPVDTHMAKLLSNLDKGFSRKMVEKIVRGDHPDKAINSTLLEHQKGLAGEKHNWPYAMAYKTLINKAASDLGWEPRQVQEAVWTAIVGIMVAKHLGAGPKAHEILKNLNRKAIRGGWSLEAIVRRPEVLRDLERLGISSKRISNAIASAAKHHESVSRGPSRTSNPAALESAAARLAGEVPSAGRNIRDVILRGARAAVASRLRSSR